MNYAKFSCPKCSFSNPISRSYYNLHTEATCCSCHQRFPLLSKYVNAKERHLVNRFRQKIHKPQPLFSTEGRVGRFQYLIGSIYAYLAAVTSLFLAGGIAQIIPQGSLLIFLPISIAAVALTACVVYGFTLKIKRMHDFDCSGWWVVGIFIPWIGLFFLWKMLLAPGTQGQNQYGLPPA